MFYVLVNGWYLGQLGDYASCRVSTTNGQYILATINGDYNGQFPFTRGAFGKYFPFAPSMGLCVPWNCNLDDIKQTIEPLLMRYAVDAHWENPKVTYTMSSYYAAEIGRSFNK